MPSSASRAAFRERPRVLLSSIAGGRTVGIPNAVLFALRNPRARDALGQEDRRRASLRGRGREPGRRASHRPAVPHAPRRGYVWSQLLFATAGILLAGITNQPTAFQGNSYLLTSVAVVVLGGTSLLGGRGFPAATVVAALFLSQLDQFVLALGVPFAVRTLVQAAALAIGVAIYTVDWAAVRRRFVSDRRPRHPRSPENSPSPGAGCTKRNTVRRSCRPDYGGEHELPQNLRGRAAVGLAALVLAGCSSDSGGGDEPAASGGTSVEGAPDWCGPDEAVVGPAGRLRRQQLEARDHGRRCRRGGQVPERRRTTSTPTVRATRRRPSPTSRAWSPPAPTRSSSSRMPAKRCSRRCAAPTRPASSRFPTASTPAEGRRGLRPVGRSRLRRRRRGMGRLDQGELPRRRQHPVPERPGRQQPGHRRAHRLRIRSDG